MKQSIKNAI